MPRAAQKKAAALANKDLKELALNELRAARKLTQEQLADLLEIDQAAVSKLEHRTDMYLSTLRRLIKAMGGDLEIRARFPDGEIRIKQFRDLNAA